MRRVVHLFYVLAVVLLLLTVTGLLILDHTSLGVRLRYGKAADPNLAAVRPLTALQSSLFPAAEYSCVGRSEGQLPGGRETAEKSHFTYVPKETRAAMARLGDCRPELLAAVRRLSDAAQGAGFALLPGGFDAGSYGPSDQGTAGATGADSTRPDLKWSWETVSADGSAQPRPQVILAGRDRFSYATLTFAQRDNLALTFTWTLIIDADTGRIESLSRFSSLSPVYVGRDTPTLWRLKI